MQRHVHLVAVARQRFVDRVVDDLVDEVMQPRRTGRPDVHGRPLTDRFKTFEDIDLIRTVIIGRAIAVIVRRDRRRGRRAAIVRLRRGSAGPLLVVLGFQFRHQSVCVLAVGEFVNS